MESVDQAFHPEGSPKVQMLSFSLPQHLMMPTVAPKDVTFTDVGFPTANLDDNTEMPRDFYFFMDLSSMDNGDAIQESTPDDAFPGAHSSHADEGHSMTLSTSWSDWVPEYREVEPNPINYGRGPPVLYDSRNTNRTAPYPLPFDGGRTKSAEHLPRLDGQLLLNRRPAAPTLPTFELPPPQFGPPGGKRPGKFSTAQTNSISHLIPQPSSPPNFPIRMGEMGGGWGSNTDGTFSVLN